tara:strand:- start:403 stop:1650 length:1248 start_codon:yes stop_codon:yes gene_type:complete
MNQKRELYTKGVSYEKEKEKLSNEKTSKKNIKLITNFLQYISSKGSGKGRIYKLSYQLRNIATVMDTDFDAVDKSKVIEYVAYLNEHEKHSDATKCDYRRALRQFYRWFKDDDVRLDDNDISVRKSARKFYKYLEEDVKITYKSEQIDPTSILSDDDIHAITIHGAVNIRDKALIKFLHETGIRTGELLNLRKKDIKIGPKMGVAHVNGKTGRRTVQFAKSKGYMSQWLNIHPLDNHDAFLWVYSSKTHLPLSYPGARKLVRTCFERANSKLSDVEQINKKCNLHWFRHSRASLLAPHLTESLLCKYMGWVPGSRQVKTYVHLCPQQLEDAFKKMNGIIDKEKIKKTTQICNCGETNDSYAHYCANCGNVLSVAIAIRDQKTINRKTTETIKVMVEMLKDPAMAKQFEDYKKRMK